MELINDGVMMLLDEVIVDGKIIGCISDEGVDWGGEKPTFAEVYAAQIRNAPYKKVKTKNGTNLFTFKMIQLIAEKIKDVIGGTAEGEKWIAPAEDFAIEAPALIKTGTGQTIDIGKASLSGMIRGTLGGDKPLYIDCEMGVLSMGKDVSPYSIYPTAAGITASEETVSFPATGGTKIVRISASGPVTVGSVTGFTIARDGNYLAITAAANSGSTAKTANLLLSLTSDSSKNVTIALSQDKA